VLFLGLLLAVALTMTIIAGRRQDHPEPAGPPASCTNPR